MFWEIGRCVRSTSLTSYSHPTTATTGSTACAHDNSVGEPPAESAIDGPSYVHHPPSWSWRHHPPRRQKKRKSVEPWTRGTVFLVGKNEVRCWVDPENGGDGPRETKRLRISRRIAMRDIPPSERPGGRADGHHPGVSSAGGAGGACGTSGSPAQILFLTAAHAL
jgi:hypothetical protein